jgi:predicted RNA-binding protein associated with RNAse of E/G family
VDRTDDYLLVVAPWAARPEPLFLGYTVFEFGDSFLERYYWRKWYSIWEVRSHRNGRTKGWYCNICQPIELEDDQLRFVDMELDVFLYPDGRFVILDEDELESAALTEDDRQAARGGLADVMDLILNRKPPFERIGPPRRVEPFWD